MVARAIFPINQSEKTNVMSCTFSTGRFLMVRCISEMSTLPLWTTLASATVVSRKIGHGSVADLNAHVTALDNKKLVCLLAFAENDTAGSYSERFDIITSQEAKACIGRHCQLPNHERGDVSSITGRPWYPARMSVLSQSLPK